MRDDNLLQSLLNSKVGHAALAANTVRHFWENVDVKGATQFAAPAASHVVKYAVPKHLKPADRKIYKLGSEIYQRESHCATCHLTDGKGNTNVYPPLVGSPWVLGSEDRLIKMTLHGLWGKMKVNGKTYDPARGVPPMTAFRSILKDEELAAVLTFVRNTWGNKGSKVEPEDVRRVRESTVKRSIFWTPEELLVEHPFSKAELAMEKSESEVDQFTNDQLELDLLAADPSELARIAISEGNANRGKALFYQSAGACFACHDPGSGAPQAGPDLKALTTSLTHEELVESILYPSKRIDKEFAQVKVLTLDGVLYTGIRVSESDDEFVLRSLAQPKPIVIKQEDIDDVVESKTSLMPANLVKALKNRGEFNDLMKYVIEIRKR